MQLLFIPFLFLSSCLCINGAGKITLEKREVKSFHSIELSGGINLFVTQGSEQELSIEAENNIVPILATYVRNEKLVIETDKCVSSHKPIYVHVVMKEIKALDISGSSQVQGQSIINSDKIKLSSSGSGRINLELIANVIDTSLSGSTEIKLSGKATHHKIESSGSSIVHASELVVKEYSIHSSGSSMFEINASTKLFIDMSGSGEVRYKGNPIVNINTSGSSTIKELQ
jgi:hypothetical protein